jgi:hypothetical protein
MKGLALFTLAALLCVVLTSCATCPGTFKEDRSIAKMREVYVRENPQCAYNDQILAGKIEKGMGIYEVLASWGFPQAREPDAGGDPDILYWTYSMVNPGTMTAYLYRLKFDDYRLVDWDVSREGAVGFPAESGREAASASTPTEQDSELSKE